MVRRPSPRGLWVPLSADEQREVARAVDTMKMSLGEWLRQLVLSEAGLINDHTDRFFAMTPQELRETIEAGLGISSPVDRKRVLARLGIVDRPIRRPRSRP